MSVVDPGFFFIIEIRARPQSPPKPENFFIKFSHIFVNIFLCLNMYKYFVKTCKAKDAQIYTGLHFILRKRGGLIQLGTRRVLKYFYNNSLLSNNSCYLSRQNYTM